MRWCDSREPSYITDRLLEAGWSRTTLKSGDYMVLNRDLEKVGITRKSVSDLLNSIGYRLDTHNPSRIYKGLQEQLEEMKEFYPERIILVEGSWSMITTGSRLVSGRGIEHHTWQEVWNFLLTWQRQRFALYLSIDEGHTIDILNSLYSYYQKPYHMGAIDTNRSVDSRVWAGPSRFRTQFKKLLDQGNSIADISGLSVEDLGALQGIGSKGAQAIYSHLHRRSN